MPFSRRRNRGRLTVRQLVAGGWGAPDGAVAGGGGGRCIVISTGEAEWRNQEIPSFQTLSSPRPGRS